MRLIIIGNLKYLFGCQLKKLRKARKLTQENLAELTGLSVEFLSYIERGIHAPSFDTLEKLSEALKVSFSELFNFEEDESKTNE